ncbi:MAG: RES family NAD+ phosphorylase [Candidatus Euphemobacter frigidus]|nr:RES family NAD+ phosphorylase [Candidatus Euphemobacter frigidus]MDP8275615.1 RES family NAD+ phosphorylase [Candidatus Euphemobacter frigidus]
MSSIFTFFRAILPIYRDRLLSTNGSLRNGGRFNPQGEFGALYLAESQSVCEAELSRKSIVPRKYHIGKIKAIIGKVLDLTDQGIVKSLDINLGEIMGDNYAMSQALGRWAHSKNYDAIIYPSITGKGKALCIFERSLKKGKNIFLLDEWDVDKIE